MIDQLIDNKNPKNCKPILVGIISKSYGIKGQVIVKSYMDPVENIVKLPIFDQNNNSISLKLVRLQPNGNLICNLKNCHDRNTADSLVKKTLYCLRGNFPQVLDDNEFYVEDLINLKVLNTEKIHIGEVMNVANYGGGEILEIEFIKDKKLIMIPFTKEFFPEVSDNYIILSKSY